jgi:DNA-binding NarL/FixJ family response regulator
VVSSAATSERPPKARGRHADARNPLARRCSEGWAARTAVEPQATGEHARKRTVDARDQLTSQEAEISRLVARGDSNREIAAQLFISPSTVEHHLHKVFRTLDVKIHARKSPAAGPSSDRSYLPRTGRFGRPV